MQDSCVVGGGFLGTDHKGHGRREVVLSVGPALGIWNINCPFRRPTGRIAHSIAFYVIHHAYNRSPLRLPYGSKMFSHRVLTRPKMMCHGGAYYDHTCGLRLILQVKHASTHDRNLHGGKILWSNYVLRRGGRYCSGGNGGTLSLDWKRKDTPAQRQSIHGSNFGDSWQRTNARKQFVIKHHALGGIVTTRTVEVDARG